MCPGISGWNTALPTLLPQTSGLRTMREYVSIVPSHSAGGHWLRQPQEMNAPDWIRTEVAFSPGAHQAKGRRDQGKGPGLLPSSTAVDLSQEHSCGQPRTLLPEINLLSPPAPEPLWVYDTHSFAVCSQRQGYTSQKCFL